MRTGTSRRRWGGPIFTILLLLALVGATAGPGQAMRSTPDSPAGASASAPASLLQFRSQGHVLGFAPDRMYTVGTGHGLIEEFVGADPVQPQATATAQPADTTGAPPLQSVTYRHLWDGITVSYTTSSAGLAMSTYRVEPRADPNRIRLRYNTDVALQPDGSLRVQHPAAKGYFTLSAPKAWQEVGGRRVPVPVAFTQPEGRVVGFAVGSYDASHPLLIDPTYAWHTFQGSSFSDWGYDIAVDGDGNVYVTGTSDAGWGTPLNPHSGGGGTDLVVMKFDSAGALLWHTFYGSAGRDDEGRGIAVDGSGHVYVTGFSGGTWGAPLQPHSGFESSVVLKLDGTGALQWHTFYGSPEPGDYGSGDYGMDIAVDGSGDLYVTGYSYAGWSGPGGEPPLHPFSGIWNIVVLKLTSAGAYQWHTFHGSASVPNAADGRGVTVDASGNVYVTGFSSGTWRGPGGEPPLHPYNEYTWDLFVLKLTSAGAYQWHTFYDATAGGIAADGSGNVYVTGFSNATWGTPLHPYTGDRDVVVMKFDSAGALQWHTFYGSAAADEGHGIAVDGRGHVYVTGESWATWGTPLNPFSGSAGSDDLVVLKLDAAGALEWHTFYGSESHDYGLGIAVDSRGNIHVTGGSSGPWGTPVNPHGGVTGYADIVVLKLAGDVDPDPDPFTFTDVTGVPLSAQQVSNTITVAGITAPAPIAVSGDASSGYAINGGAWTSAPGSVNNGDTVQVRQTSAATYGASVATTLTIGGVSDTFTSTTTTTLVGSITIVGTPATVIDMGTLTTATGSITISGNTSATVIDVSSTTTVSGDLVVSGNTAATVIDLGSLTTVGGDLTISGNTSATVIDVNSTTTVGGDLTVVDNGGAAVNMSAGADVGGSLTIETTGTGSFSMGDGTVTGDATLKATGYTDMSGTTPGGMLDLTATTLGAVMHVQLQAESFTTPVTFSITRLDPIALAPESGVDANGAPATIDPVAAYQFTFAIPTLNREAALSFDIDIAQLDASTQTALLDAVAAGTATLVTKGDAAGSVFQAFPICIGADVPTVGGCVRVEAFDALGQPTTGTPALVRFSNVVGHFSTWAVAIVTTTPSTHTVTIAAPDPLANEAGLTPGRFRVSRTGSTANALTVFYTVGGNATPGSDYVALPGSVIILAGQSSADSLVTPLQDSLQELPETITVTLTPGAGYAVGTPKVAVVVLRSDEDITQVVSVLALDPTASEARVTRGRFLITRVGRAAAALTVSYRVGGTATPGSDYVALPGTVTIPAGAFTALVPVIPLQDTAPESPETVTLTLAPSARYAVGIPATATVTLVSDE